MAQDEGNKGDKFDFNLAGEAPGYISLEQARLLAMQTARDDPGNYGRRFASMRMVYQPVEVAPIVAPINEAQPRACSGDWGRA